jgi:hypothetical protein
VTVPLTFWNSPRTFEIMRWRTLNVALVCEASMVHVVLRGVVVSSVVLVVCMIVSWFPDR